jgi:fused signal recognition particle receptor
MGLFDLFKRKKADAEAVPEPPKLEAEAPAVQAPRAPAVSRMRTALNRTRAFFATAFAADPTQLVDDDYFDSVVDNLVLADAGVELAGELAGRVRREMENRGMVLQRDVAPVARDVLSAALRDVRMPAALSPDKLSVVLLVGVNGSGKTTLAAKLAYRLKNEGRRVLLAAADTFRAAAVEQLKIWAGRAGVDIVAGQQDADPASVVFDAAQAALARDVEVLIVDTAGRLQTKHNLMAELTKITRTVDKACPNANIAHILVLDATVGQNALSQAELFNDCCPLTGLALTKLDGTAKGGAVFAVVKRLRVPVLYAGVGETLDDLLDFDTDEFVAGLLP